MLKSFWTNYVKKPLQDSVIFFIIHISSFMLGLMLGAFTVDLILLAFESKAETILPYENYLEFIFITPISLAIMFLFHFRESYQRRSFSLKKLVAPLTVYVLFQQLIADGMDYVSYISGTVGILLDAIFQKGDNYKKINPLYEHIGMTLMMLFVIIPLIIVARYLGDKKHKKELLKASCEAKENTLN